ncbi:MAG TPA: hypothetical protein VGP76_05865 [Planctomycetaceae bacterium]|jgi:hypothetical protein|nr:hypothetical protein [Planctomycetaceae bacterium]
MTDEPKKRSWALIGRVLIVGLVLYPLASLRFGCATAALRRLTLIANMNG